MAKIVKWEDIPYSPEAEEAIANLKEGKAFVVRMKHVNSSLDNLPKIQIEFAEKINNPGRAQTALSMLNALDDRFSSRAIRTWETADASIAEKMFGNIPQGEASVEILKDAPPTLRIQITEKVESELTPNQIMYAEQNYLKRRGKDGDFFYTPSGERVASIRELVQVNPGQSVNHTYLEGAYKASHSLQDVLGGKSAISSEIMNAGK